MRALLSVYDKTGTGRVRRGPPRARRRARVERRHRAGDRRRPASRSPTSTRSPASPEMLDHRVVTLHPKIHGGILADPSKASHRADLERVRHRAVRPRRLEPLPVRRATPASSSSTSVVPRWCAPRRRTTRTSASSRARTQYDDGARRAARARALHATRRAARSRSRRSRAPPRTTPRSSSGSRSGRGAAAAPRPRARADRRDAALRREPAPARRALPDGAAPRAGGTASPSTAALALSYLNYYDTDAAWQLVHDLGDRPAVAIIKHANPCGVAIADDLATAYQRALECDERSAFGGIVAFNRPIDDATAARDGRRPAGRRRDRARLRAAASLEALRKKRKNTRLLEAPAPEPPTRVTPPDLAAASWCRTRAHFAAGRDDWRVVTKVGADRRAVGRRRARLADLRAREVELDRAGEGRPGRRHRRRAAEPGRGGRDRGEEGGGPRGRRRVRVGRVLPVPRRRRGRGRRRASRSWCSRAAR